MICIGEEKLLPEFSTRQRCIAAAITGLFLHIMIFHPWIPYSHRESMLPGVWPMAIAFVLAGLVLTLGTDERRGLIVICLVGGMFAGNAALISYDWIGDPTTHNLFPFEFVMIGFAVVPAAFGAFLSHLVARLRA
jgi:hypothetical protein